MAREFDTALYTLWFGLNYGSILTSAALYKTLEGLGKKPCLLQKPPSLWNEHYADRNNIAGLFAYKNFKVLEIFDNEDDMELLERQINTHVVGSDIVWSYNVVGKSGNFFFLDQISDHDTKVAYCSSFGSSLPEYGVKNEYFYLLKKFKKISVPDSINAGILKQQFSLDADIVLDPVFLCDRSFYINCAAGSAAKLNDNADSYIFVYMNQGDKRKRQFIQKGNNIVLAKHGGILRCMIDINRYEESKEALGLDPAYFIRTEDWLHYIINSEFVITDNIYAMYFALIFEKPFAILVNEDEPGVFKIREFLASLGLEERLVILQGDLKAKEYLFRKPVRYAKVTPLLDEMKAFSLQWLKDAIGAEQNDREGGDTDGNAQAL